MSAPETQLFLHGYGWYGFALDLAQIEGSIAMLRTAAAEVERPSGLPPLEVSVTPHPACDLTPRRSPICPSSASTGSSCCHPDPLATTVRGCSASSKKNPPDCRSGRRHRVVSAATPALAD